MMMFPRRWSFGSRKGQPRRPSVSISGDVIGETRLSTAVDEGETACSSGKAMVAPPVAAAAAVEDRWSLMLPELMGEIIQRVESSEDRWPERGNVVSCACVCRGWRGITTSLVRPPSETSMITFPSSLQQPGPMDCPIKCFIKRNKKTSTFYLYLSLSQSLTDNGKFLLAAQKFRRGAYNEYIISLDADDLSQGSNAYLGKLRSDFLGINFTIYSSQPPYNGAKASGNRGSRRFASKRISPQVPAGNFDVGQVSYKWVVLRSKGPRRMLCTIQCPPAEKASKEEPRNKSVASDLEASSRSVVLRNKAPRWHQNLQCWCLNFHGRVTVASVKNFQLVAADPDQAGGTAEDERVLLQFGKVGDDVFTMDYKHPLSAFQAFAICLTSFGSKFACE